MESNEVNYQREVKYGGCGKKTEIIVITMIWELELINCPVEIFYFNNVSDDDAVGISLN